MKKSTLLLFAGILMILSSGANYLLNDDYVSFGIFLFSGLGFTMLGISEFVTDQIKKQRIKQAAMLFFVLAVVVALYWLFAGRLKLI